MDAALAALLAGGGAEPLRVLADWAAAQLSFGPRGYSGRSARFYERAAAVVAPPAPTAAPALAPSTAAALWDRSRAAARERVGRLRHAAQQYGAEAPALLHWVALNCRAAPGASEPWDLLDGCVSSPGFLVACRWRCDGAADGEAEWGRPDAAGGLGPARDELAWALDHVGAALRDQPAPRVAAVCTAFVSAWRSAGPWPSVPQLIALAMMFSESCARLARLPGREGALCARSVLEAARGLLRAPHDPVSVAVGTSCLFALAAASPASPAASAPSSAWTREALADEADRALLGFANAVPAAWLAEPAASRCVLAACSYGAVVRAGLGPTGQGPSVPAHPWPSALSGVVLAAALRATRSADVVWAMSARARGAAAGEPELELVEEEARRRLRSRSSDPALRLLSWASLVVRWGGASESASAGERAARIGDVRAAAWESFRAWHETDRVHRLARARSAVPRLSSGPASRRQQEAAWRLATSQYLFSASVLDALSAADAVPLPPDALAAALDALSCLEFCRVEYAVHQPLVQRLSSVPLHTGGRAGDAGPRDSVAGWFVRWLWPAADDASVPAAAAPAPPVAVPAASAAAAAAAPFFGWCWPGAECDRLPATPTEVATAPPPGGDVPLHGHRVGIARDAFVLELALGWLARAALPAWALEGGAGRALVHLCLRHVPACEAALGARALLVLAGLVELVEGPSDASAAARAVVEDVRAELDRVLPQALELALGACPFRQNPAWVSQGMLALFARLPVAHGCKPRAVLAVSSRAADVARLVLPPRASSRASAAAGAGTAISAAAATLAGLAVDLLQYLPLSELRRALETLRPLAEDATIPPERRRAMVDAMVQKVSGSYDLYRRDAVAFWLMDVGVVGAPQP